MRRARAGEGPSLIECRTYRLRGHVESEASFLQGTYRTDEEVAEWATRDPVARLEAYLDEHAIAPPSAREAIEAEIAATVADAVAYATDSPYPAPDQARRFMFA